MVTRLAVVLLGTATVVLLIYRNNEAVGEWLRRLSDRPTNLVLIGTSGFEREGRDPAKR